MVWSTTIMDTEKLIQLAQRVSDRVKDNPDLQPGLDQLKRLLKAMEKGSGGDSDLAFRVLTAMLMLDITIGTAQAPYDEKAIEAIMGDIPETSTGAQDTPDSGQLEFPDKPSGPTVPTPAPNPKTGQHFQGSGTQAQVKESTNLYLDYMHGNNKLY